MRHAWPILRLDEVARIRRGASPRPKGDPRYFAGKIPWLKIGDVPPGSRYVSITKEGVTEAGKERSVYVDPGTLLLSNSASVGRPVITKMGACIHDGWLAIDNIRNDLSQDFLYWLLIASQRQLEQLAPTGTQRNLNIGLVSNFMTPVPPLPEQNCIVAILDAAEDIRRLREQADRRTADFIPALFHEMFGDPAMNPKGWPKAKLGTTAGSVRYGLGQPPEITSDGIPLLRATNVKRGKISPVGLIRVQKDMVPVSRNAFLTGNDVLVVRSGAYTGDVAQVGKEWEGSVAGYDLVVSPGENMTGEFMASFLLSKFIQEDYFGGLKQRAAQPHLNSRQLSDAPLLLPPLPLQKSFSARVAEIRAIEASQASSRSRLDALFQSLLHRAFRGEF